MKFGFLKELECCWMLFEEKGYIQGILFSPSSGPNMLKIEEWELLSFGECWWCCKQSVHCDEHPLHMTPSALRCWGLIYVVYFYIWCQVFLEHLHHVFFMAATWSVCILQRTSSDITVWFTVVSTFWESRCSTPTVWPPASPLDHVLLCDGSITWRFVPALPRNGILLLLFLLSKLDCDVFLRWQLVTFKRMKLLGVAVFTVSLCWDFLLGPYDS